MITESISFDRAADYYDRTRALPAELAARQTEMLAGVLTGCAPVLEIGVGTGRIALPLWQKGVPIVGLDLSVPMLQRLRANAGGDHFPLVMGDATRLPFGEATLDAVVAAHVLHLIPDWRQAIAEIHRVLRSGGVFLQTRGTPWGRRSDVARVFFEAAGKPDWPPGATGNDAVDRAAADHGFGVKGLDELTTPTRLDLYEMVDQLEQGLFSACWGLDSERRKTAAQATRTWLQRQYGAPPAWTDDSIKLRWRLYKKR